MKSSCILVALLILSCNESSMGKRGDAVITVQSSLIEAQIASITDPRDNVDGKTNDKRRYPSSQTQQHQGKLMARFLKNDKVEQEFKRSESKRNTLDTPHKTMRWGRFENNINHAGKHSFEMKASLIRIPTKVKQLYNEIYSTRKGNKLNLKPTGAKLKRHKRDITGLPLDGFGSLPQLQTLLPATTAVPAWHKGAAIGMAPVLLASEEPTLMPQDVSSNKDVIMTPVKTTMYVEPVELEDQNADEADLQTEPEPWPEPGPDWTTAYMYLGVAWFFHIYGVAFTMFLIGTLAAITLVDIVTSKNMTSRGLSTSLNCLLLLFGYSRGISLVLNPYGSLERISLLTSRLMWSVGFPCLTSMLTTLLLVLLDTTKVSLGPPRFQQFHVVIKLSASHFIVVLGTDIVLSFYLQLKVLLLVCQLIYVTWSILLTVGYYRVGYLISRNFKASRGSHIPSDRGAQRLERLIFACGTVALFNCITHLYGATGVFGVYSDLTFVPAWPWWVFQTLMRLEEISMCIIVLILAGKSRRECSSAVEGEASFICRWWMKLKSRLATSNVYTRKSGTDKQLERDKRDMTNIVESWGTYGSNANNASRAPTSSNDGQCVSRQVSLDTVNEG